MVRGPPRGGGCTAAPPPPGVCRETLQGLEALHAAGLPHGNVKAANLFVTEGAVLLGDYGLNMQSDVDRVGGRSTCSPFWMAPEVIMRSEGAAESSTAYTPQADVWSLGITVCKARAWGCVGGGAFQGDGPIQMGDGWAGGMGGGFDGGGQLRRALTRKRHALPHSTQPRHTNDGAPRTRKRHQQEHRPQRPTERSDPTQHAKGRTGDCPGPRKGTTTRRTVTRGGCVCTCACDVPTR